MLEDALGNYLLDSYEGKSLTDGPISDSIFLCPAYK